MLAAATSWDGLAAELGSAAQSFTSITSGLTQQAWQGPASAAMLQTATQYAGFLSEATAQAQTAAAQAQAVVSAFESAQAAIVHPLAVAANRNSFVQLVMSNLFGQNAPAIAAMEADYEQMWAQDVAAMVGYHGGASAAAAALPSWTTTLQGIASQLSGAVSANPAASAVSALNSAASSSPLGNIEQKVVNLINAPTEFLFGTPLINTGPTATLGGSSTGTVPLTMYAGTEPLVNATVGTGSATPLLVDTGSTGLVIPFQKAGGLLGLLQLGLPTGGGISGYSGGLDYAYLTYNAQVNFGGGLVTSATPVDLELFAWPTSIQSALTNGFSFQNFFAPDGASGVLGIGPNSGGPGPSIATQALPGSFGQGVLINETTTNPYLQFGSQPASVGGLNPHSHAHRGADHHTGCEHGRPQPICRKSTPAACLEPSRSARRRELPFVVTDPTTGHCCTSTTTESDYSPTPSNGVMNTGSLIFQEHPIYVGWGGQGTTVIY